MSDLTITGTSQYSVGQIDTATTLQNNISPRQAEHVNGPAAACVSIEQVLGVGTVLKGSTQTLGDRLAVGLTAQGTLRLNNDASLTGPLSVANGGTGRTTLTTDKVLIGNAAGLVTLGTGLSYQGPTSTGTGTSAAHEGTVTISADQPLSGVHYYTNFTLNAAKTATLDASRHRLVIIATDTITINGTIAAGGRGAAGVAAATGIGESGTIGGNGFSQAGGGGGSGGVGGGAGAPGGAVFVHSIVVGAGGTGGGVGVNLNGSSPAQLVADAENIAAWVSIMGGASGGGGAAASDGSDGGASGAGGGSIVLVAPIIVLGSGSILNTSGSNGGGAGGNGGGGGGGGAGNIYLACRSYTDNGTTFTLTGGSGGSGAGAGGNGAAGAAGVKQINIYA